MNNVHFKIIDYDSPVYKVAVNLREGVLRKPLGLTFLPEELEKEKNHTQIVGFMDHEVILR